MWWFKQLFCRAALLLLVACSPVFSSLTPHTQEKLKEIKVERVLDREGQYLWLRLTRQLSPNQHKTRYRLQIDLKSSKEAFGLTLEGVAFRYRVTTTLNYTLLNMQGKKLREKTLFVHGSFNVLENDFFAVTAVEKMTTEANIDRLADDLIFDLVGYFESSQAHAS